MTLRLPEEWNLAPGVGRPEIVAAHERVNVKWVASGKAWYVLYHQERPWVMEMKIEVSDLRRKQKPGGQLVMINGHEAWVRRWQRGRGLWRRKRIQYVEVTYKCAESDRTILLEFSGRCEPEGFEQLFEYLPYWGCH